MASKSRQWIATGQHRGTDATLFLTTRDELEAAMHVPKTTSGEILDVLSGLPIENEVIVTNDGKIYGLSSLRTWIGNGNKTHPHSNNLFSEKDTKTIMGPRMPPAAATANQNKSMPPWTTPPPLAAHAGSQLALIGCDGTAAEQEAIERIVAILSGNSHYHINNGHVVSVGGNTAVSVKKTPTGNNITVFNINVNNTPTEMLTQLKKPQPTVKLPKHQLSGKQKNQTRKLVVHTLFA